MSSLVFPQVASPASRDLRRKSQVLTVLAMLTTKSQRTTSSGSVRSIQNLTAAPLHQFHVHSQPYSRSATCQHQPKAPSTSQSASKRHSNPSHQPRTIASRKTGRVQRKAATQKLSQPHNHPNPQPPSIQISHYALHR
ncbi:hypothetical protein M3J09_002665 [Ascochyta lentis]